MDTRWMAAVLGLALAAGAGADGIGDWAKAREAQKVSDLTVGDWMALEQAKSVERQERIYVVSSGVESFLVPGLGQFQTGDPLGGTLNLAGRVALVGGTIWGVWALLPDDLKTSGLDQRARMDKWKNYWLTDPVKVAPAAGVAVGGLVLELVQSHFAAEDAMKRARENLADGKVVFEPKVNAGFLGFGARM